MPREILSWQRQIVISNQKKGRQHVREHVTGLTLCQLSVSSDAASSISSPPPTHTRVQRWRVMPTNNWNICAWLQKCRFSKPGCKQWQRGKPASPRCVRLCRRGKSRDPDYAISYVPAGGGRRTQRACFLILCETAYIFPSSSSHLPFCHRIQRHFITYHACLGNKCIFDSVLLHCWILF